ncbi:ClpP/crotonase-like domain-containing protein [Paraphysoderma sedebokerense]|nr:ClpP/crotonase-like domain-containing protein [Paraphysoderma sedebokerense]
MSSKSSPPPANLKSVILSLTPPLATVTLNNPKQGNSITPTMAAELISVFSYLSSSAPLINYIVLTATGKYFCTGMNLGSSLASSSSSTPSSDQDPTQSSLNLFTTIRNCPKPIITLVNGPALGGGVGILFLSDIRIMLSNAYISFPEIKRGIIPSLISLFIVPELGVYKTKQFFLTGQKVTAKECLELGVVSDVVQNLEEGKEKVQKYLDVLKSSAPNAMGMAKRLVRTVGRAPWMDNDVVNEVKGLFNEMLKSDEAVYGISSFLSKEKPDWVEFQKSKL